MGLQPEDKNKIKSTPPSGSAIDLDKAVFVLSDGLDFVGQDSLHHGKRVGYLAVACAQEAGLSERWTADLARASLLHDIGLSSSRDRSSMLSFMTRGSTEPHSIAGELYLREVPCLAPLAPVVRLHHTRWAEMEPREDERTALLANVIHLADRLDALLGGNSTLPLKDRLTEVRTMLAERRGRDFAPLLVDALVRLVEGPVADVARDTGFQGFWDHRNGLSAPAPLSAEELLRLARLFARVVDAKSTHTAEHSHGVSNFAVRLGRAIGLTREAVLELELAGLVHDLGKLAVPDEVLDKPGPLDPHERRVMQSHAAEGKRLLSRIPGLERVARLVGMHHERLDGRGYPDGLRGDEIPIEASVIAVADVFQALVQDRPYRSGMSPNAAAGVLRDLAREGALHPTVVAAACETLPACIDDESDTPPGFALRLSRNT